MKYSDSTQYSVSVLASVKIHLPSPTGYVYEESVLMSITRLLRESFLLKREVALMGHISDAMQNLVDEIRSSAESRHVKISEMRSDTHNVLERFYLERQDMADALREKFSSDNAARREVTQQLMGNVRSFMDDVRSDFQDMANTLEEKLSSDRAALRKASERVTSDVRSDLRDMATALQKKFSSDNAARREAVQQLMNNIGASMDNTRSDLESMASALKERLSSDETARRDAAQQFMGELASDRRGAQEIWRGSSAGVVEESAPEPVAEEETVEEVAPSPEDQIVEVVGRHPEGIRLVDIGNELGVDWRGLIGAIKPLVDEGRVEKIDNLYYPKS
jgi:hypothetical protein